MALESTDLFVVQKESGANEIRKTSLSQISAFLQTDGGVVSNITGVNPITVTTDGSIAGSSTNSPVITIESSAVGQLGAVALFDGSVNIGKPSDSSSYAEWASTLDSQNAMTLQATALKFTISDFSSLEDV